MAKDLERIKRTRKALHQQQIDALVCRLPENIVMLTGYWPMNGFAFLVFPVDKEPILIAPVPEEELAREGWVEDLRTFKWGLVDSGDPYVSIASLLKQAAVELGLVGKRIGYEGSFEFIAAPYVGAEPSVFSQASLAMFQNAFGENLSDATSLIHKLRLYKTPAEAERLRTANDIARIGLQAFFENVVPGNSEIQIAAAVETAIMQGGTGYKGVKVARAWASVMSGPRGVAAYKPHLLSTQRRMEEGDFALLELAAVVDGWWSDLTRTRVAGHARPEDCEKWKAVVDAQSAALAVIRPGVASNQVDRAAREVIEQRGLGSYFIHHTGHGLGLRYHEPEPFLHPAVETILEAGMVSSVEPGIYIEGWGGMRCEDNIMVTEGGVEILSEFSRQLAD
ncbi:MAG TPA: Xaa-Pro peptidase family protein [Anaerolineales bacterium]|nr:Xaa-Pro peptidase family protein [Anaerolineales bacterium]